LLPMLMPDSYYLYIYILYVYIRFLFSYIFSLFLVLYSFLVDGRRIFNQIILEKHFKLI
jgi:hypothetical protein